MTLTQYILTFVVILAPVTYLGFFRSATLASIGEVPDPRSVSIPAPAAEVFDALLAERETFAAIGYHIMDTDPENRRILFSSRPGWNTDFGMFLPVQVLGDSQAARVQIAAKSKSYSPLQQRLTARDRLADLIASVNLPERSA